MGNITALRKEMAPQRAYPAFHMDDEAATLFPELAYEVRKAWVTADQRLGREERGRISRQIGKHFKAMEQVLALLHTQNQDIYASAMESYLTMKLNVLKGQIARSKILHLYCEM